MCRQLRFALALALVPSIQTPAQSFDDVWKESVATLCPKLTELARWCGANGLAGTRDDVFERILILDPNHAEARRVLQDTKQKDGSWARSSSYKRPKDGLAASAETFAARWKETVGPVTDRLLSLAAPPERDTRPASVRYSTLTRVARLDPADPRAHKLLREVEVEGRWVLEETAAARRQRPNVAKQAAAAKAAVRVDEGAPTAAERDLGPKWKSAFVSPRVRVLAATTSAEAKSMAQAATAILDVADAVIGDGKPRGKPFTIFHVEKGEDAHALVDKHPLPDEMSRYFLALKGGAWLSGDTLAMADETPTGRIESSTRAVVNGYFGTAFEADISLEPTLQALSTLIGALVSGKRPLQVDEAKLDDAADIKMVFRLNDPKVDWMVEARQLSRAGRFLPLKDCFKDSAVRIGSRGQFGAAIFAEYMLYGRHAELLPLLAEIGKSGGSRMAVPKALGCELDELDVRIARWLEEYP